MKIYPSKEIVYEEKKKKKERNLSSNKKNESNSFLVVFKGRPLFLYRFHMAIWNWHIYYKSLC